MCPNGLFAISEEPHNSSSIEVSELRRILNVGWFRGSQTYKRSVGIFQREEEGEEKFAWLLNTSKSRPNHFPISKPQSLWIEVSLPHENRRSTDFESSKIAKRSVGWLQTSLLACQLRWSEWKAESNLTFSIPWFLLFQMLMEIIELWLAFCTDYKHRKKYFK